MSMQYSRRTFLRIAGAAAGGALLAACQPTAAPTVAVKEPTAAPKAPTAASQEAVTLQWYYATGGGTKDVEVTSSIHEEFTKLNPNIKVEMITAVQGVTVEQKLQTMIAGGTPPDLVYTGASVSFAARGVFIDIFPLLEKSGRSLDDQEPNAREVYAIKGGNFLWALPCQLSTMFGVVNMDLFAAAGIEVPGPDWANADWTWDRYLEVAEALTKRAGDTVETWGTSWVDLRRRGPHMFGGAWYDEPGTTCVCDTPEAIKGFDYGHDLIYESNVCPTPSQNELLEGGFLSGKVAMAPMGPWSIPTYLTIKDFKWTLVPIPYASELGVSARRWNPAWCNSIAISSKDKIDQSWELAQYMVYTDDQYAKWCWDGLGRIPSRVAAQTRWMESAKVMGPEVPWSVTVDAFGYAGADLDAEQGNAQQMLDMIRAEYQDAVQGDPDAVPSELAAAIKPKLQALLDPV